MSTSRQELGKWGEDQAAQFLEESGYVILARNVRTPYGEIDLVAHHNFGEEEPSKFANLFEPVIVFVEVKTRRTTAFGYPEDAITKRKKSHMLESAQSYMGEHPHLDGPWRLDVIAIQCTDTQHTPTITHFENVVNFLEPGD